MLGSPKSDFSLSLHTPNYSESTFNVIQTISALFVWLISHQPAVLFSQNKPAINNQPAVLFSQNKPAPAISHQPNEQAVHPNTSLAKVNLELELEIN
jgi:hypothetical protein